MLPGMEAMATSMMKAKMKKKGVASLEELRDLCLEADVKFIACQMTVDLFEFQKKTSSTTSNTAARQPS
jgi:peroxiredoxin family protein